MSLTRSCLQFAGILASLALTFPSSAASEEIQFKDADYEFFERKVRPLLVQHCYECHSAKAKDLHGGLRLDSRTAMFAGGDTGPAIVARKPQASLLIEAVRYQNTDLQMPPKGKLSDQEIALLTKWIEIGAPMPDADDPTPQINKTIDFDEGRKFWSFQPVERQPLPRNKTAWGSNRLDAFILAELEERGLTPSPAADRRALIRRVTFNLTGLPPTSQQVAAFLDDESPNAYARLIDRLLASPQYGERWGRFWLDKARYTDTTASWLKSTAHAYLYRDWVVSSLNEDLPYDQFVKRQLATDLMSETGPDETPALGFIGLSPTYWKELKLDKDVIKVVVAEEWEERIDALGRTFLGLTIACARCHDHKFDPISARDYYALAGVFASTRIADRPIIDEASAKTAQAARDEVKSLEGQLKTLSEQKPPPADLASQRKELINRIAEIKRSTPFYDNPLACAVDEASLYVLANGPDATKLEYRPGEPRDLAMHIRGNPAKLGETISRRFLTVLSPGTPQPFQNGSGRLELAQAIVGDAAPLAARVIVNRIWEQHFGSGLVATPSNFGSQGARPTHPELLDDLAARFIEHGWSIKWLHREILLSATHRQASAHDDANHASDPDNRWLWRMHRRRLDVEAWRDAMLAVSGELDSRIGGAPVELSDATNRRRTIYGKIHRRDVYDMLRLYDFPDPTSHSASRATTTTPLQQLFVLNSDFVRRQSAVLAARVQLETPDAASQVSRAYELIFNRPPTGQQLQLGVAFLAAADEPLRQYIQVLLGSNEFMFID